MYKTFASALLATAAFAASGTFTYNEQGADWGQIHDANDNFPNALCDSGNQQSPIDLTFDGTERNDMLGLLTKYNDFALGATTTGEV